MLFLIASALADTPPTPEITDAVPPGTAAEWKKLVANPSQFGKEKAAACPGDDWKSNDPAGLALQINQCGGMETNDAITRLATAMDHGQGDAIVAAGVVEQCTDLLTSNGDVQPTQWLRWKGCQRMAGLWTDDTLDAALRARSASDWVRLDFEIRAQTARGFLETARPTFAKVEQGYPGLVKLYDDTTARVDEKYAPRIASARADLLAIDPWLATLSGGPGFATGCHDKWTGVLQAYVDGQGVTAKGTALWDTLRDPVGVGFTEAIAACHKASGDGVFADMLARRVVPGARRTTGWNEAFDDVIRRLKGAAFTYGGQAIPSNMGYGPPLGAWKDPVRAYIGDYFESKDRPYSFEETVATVTVAGDSVLLSFPKHKGEITAPTNCGHDYSHPLGIDRYGNIDYPFGCSGKMVIASDLTFRTAKVPAWQVEKITAGSVVAVQFPPGARYYVGLAETPDAVDAQVFWVKRGADITWMAGVSAR